MKIKELEKSGLQAIKNLRESKLKNGNPFMINSEALPSNQCYMEYPDGSIQLVTLSRKKSDFEVIDTYYSDKAEIIRKKYKLV